MIPPVTHPGTRSHGELELFRRLRDDPVTADWTVLHSLDVAQHSVRVAGEIDFVVIVPGKGILCLEVKGTTRLRRQEGMWYYGNDPSPDSRGPFKQAAEATHSLRRRLSERCPELSQILFWSGVVFPFVAFDLTSEEWHSWQIIDTKAFRRLPIGQLILEMLDAAHAHVQAKSGLRWYSRSDATPTPKQCQRIADILRPDFEFFESPGARAQRLESELKHYTSEQYAALDAMEDNERVMFVGPAGVGKTLLAIEAARRDCARGAHVLLLCFNRLLGNWLVHQAGDLAPLVETSTLHGKMVQIVSVEARLESGDADFWRTDLPIMASTQLLDRPNLLGAFDELVIDEAQDILSDDYLDFLDLLLRGGLRTGRLRLFADMEKQAIFTAGHSPQEVCDRRLPGIVKFSLRTNCRNTPRVAAMAHLLGGLTPPYAKVLRPDDGVEPQLRFYDDDDQAGQVLKYTLGQLHSEGFSAEDIVILSPRRDDVSLAGTASKLLAGAVAPLAQRSENQVPYATIHAYKGLEARAVVVTDVSTVADENSLALFYIAVTRTTQRLVIIASSHLKRELRRAFMGKPVF